MALSEIRADALEVGMYVRAKGSRERPASLYSGFVTCVDIIDDVVIYTLDESAQIRVDPSDLVRIDVHVPGA